MSALEGPTTKYVKYCMCSFAQIPSTYVHMHEKIKVYMYLGKQGLLGTYSLYSKVHTCGVDLKIFTSD